jgi:alpha-aminoadipate carrier protein LysW
MHETRCPNCDAVITVEEPREGIVVMCPECAVELEVISADPLELDFPADWQED